MSRIPLFSWLSGRAVAMWHQYRGLALWLQGAIALLALVIVIGGGYKLTHSDATTSAQSALPSVTVSPISALGGNGGSVGFIGAVRSVTEADVLAQSGGTVTSVHAKLGSTVPAGYIILELDNASQRAAVLQAEGSYEAALAAQKGLSPTDITASARNTFTTAYSTVDTLLKSDIDQFFGEQGGQGPRFLISPAPFDFSYFPLKRQALTTMMIAWRDRVAAATSTDPLTLLDAADEVVHAATSLGNDMSQAATKNGTDATTAQLTALATARSGFAGVQASITAAKQAYQSQNTSATAGTDASVKIALGALRAVQAQLEKTYVRAPISGTINFLPEHIGDYVTSLAHVATVAQNGALEIVGYVSEETRAQLSVGTKVVVEDQYAAVITSIAPALDPVTKQIEVHLALTGTSSLLNGQSVRVSLPGTTVATTAARGPVLLPLTALKLTPSARVVFSVGEDGRLVAHAVDIGDVHGDRIEINTALSPDLEIVVDARGLSEGEKVTVAATP